MQQGYGNDDNGCFVLPEDVIPDSGSVIAMLYLESQLLDHIRVRARIGAVADCDDDPIADHSGEPMY